MVERSFKRIVCGAIAAFAFAGLSGFATAASEFSVNVQPGSATRGSFVDVVLKGFGIVDLDGIDLHVSFNPAVLEFQASAPFSLGTLTQNFMAPVFDLGTGPGLVTVEIAGLPVSGDGNLLVAHFIVKADAPLGTTTLSFQSRSTDPLDGYVVPLTSGQLTVAAVPEPSQWLAMLLGLSMVGTMVVRRRSAR